MLTIRWPGYVWPGDTTTWATALHPLDRPQTITINPANGPGPGPNPAYTALLDQAHTVGAEVIGYVPLGYGWRPLADVLADVEQYATWYPSLDGIFYDEYADSIPKRTAQQLHGHPRHRFTHTTPARTVFNPGATPTTALARTARRLRMLALPGSHWVSQEGRWADLAQTRPRPLAFPTREWILVWDCPAIDVAYDRLAAWGWRNGYVTPDGPDGNPWDTYQPPPQGH